MGNVSCRRWCWCWTTGSSSDAAAAAAAQGAWRCTLRLPRSCATWASPLTCALTPLPPAAEDLLLWPWALQWLHHMATMHCYLSTVLI